MSEETKDRDTSGTGIRRKTSRRKQTSVNQTLLNDRYHSLFNDVPIALLEEDFSMVKKHLDELRNNGIKNFNKYFKNNPQELVKYVDMVKIIDANQAALKLFHAGSKPGLLKGLRRIFTEDTYSAFNEQLTALADGSVFFEKERVIRTLDGEEKHVHLILSLAPGFEDNWGRVLLSMADITARKLAEEELKSNHEYPERLNNSLQEVIFRIKLPERTIDYVNYAVRNTFGYKENECLGKTTEFLYPSRQDYRSFGTLLENTMLKGKQALHTELSMKKKNGTLFPAEIATTFLKEDDEITGVISILRDITRRRRAEDSLRLSEARLTEAQRIAHMGNWDWDISTSELMWSDEIYRIFGVTKQKSGVTYDTFLNSIHPHDREFVEHSVNEALYEGQLYDIDHRVVLPDGRVRIVHEKGEVIFDSKGKPVRMIGTVQDITELKRIEDELRTLSRRLVRIQEEERRTIARELHDEIGQTLTVLKLMLDRAKHPPTGDAISTLTEAEELVNGLMEQVRKLSLELRPGMLDDIGLLPTLLWYFDNYTAKTNIKVNFKHSGLQVPFSSDVMVAAYRIVQEALTNILRHADVTEINVTAWTDQQMLSIRIEDKGKGFDLKSISPGISGGLLGMYERADSLDGELTIDSTPGQGTTIVTRLPLSGSSTTSGEEEI